MELLTGHLGKQTGGLDSMTRLMERMTDHAEKLDDRFEKLLGIVEQLAEGFTESQKLVVERFQQLSEQLETLTEFQKNTEEKLNALIDVVDGLIRRSSPPEA